MSPQSELLFGGGQKSSVAERAAVAAEAFKAGEFRVLARRQFQKFAPQVRANSFWRRLPRWVT